MRPEAERFEEQVRRVFPVVEAGEGLLVDSAQSEEGILRGKTVLVSIHKLNRFLYPYPLSAFRNPTLNMIFAYITYSHHTTT